MKLRTLSAHPPSGKRVLVRVDFNVAFDANGNAVDDVRLRAAMPTIRLLLEHDNSVILVSHLGRPGGRKDPALSLVRLLPILKKYLGDGIHFIGECCGPKVAALVRALKPRDLLLLENVRFFPGEEAGDPVFARALADIGADLFVNDAFGASHRPHASITGIPQFLPSYAGLLLELELKELTRIIEEPRRPLIVVIGGAKLETKLGLLERFLTLADGVALGGIIANTVLKAKGIAVGESHVEEALLAEAQKLELTSPKLHLPIDVLVSRNQEGSGPATVRAIGAVAGDEFIFDIGPDSQLLFSKICARAGMILWNGPMGLVETPQFVGGTEVLAKAIAASPAYSVVGGGDTTAVIQKLGLEEKFNYISTGGGAMLEFLAGKKLPGIEALRE